MSDGVCVCVCVCARVCNFILCMLVSIACKIHAYSFCFLFCTMLATCMQVGHPILVLNFTILGHGNKFILPIWYEYDLCHFRISNPTMSQT